MLGLLMAEIRRQRIRECLVDFERIVCLLKEEILVGLRKGAQFDEMEQLRDGSKRVRLCAPVSFKLTLTQIGTRPFERQLGIHLLLEEFGERGVEGLSHL